MKDECEGSMRIYLLVLNNRLSAYLRNILRGFVRAVLLGNYIAYIRDVGR